jgi:hypothetical protein
MIVLRIGLQRDTLVGIQVDSAAGLELLKTLFGEWVVTTAIDQHEILIDPAFSVYLADKSADQRGAYSVPQLRFGSHVIARSRNSHDIVRALATILGGIHAEQPATEQREDEQLLDGQHIADGKRINVGLRPFIVGSAAVLVEAQRPILVNDTRLEQLGARELPVWTTSVSPASNSNPASVTFAPYLCELAWEAVQLVPPTDHGTYRLAAIAAIAHGSEAELMRTLASASPQRAWFNLIDELRCGGKIHQAGTRNQLRDVLAALVG